MSLSELQIQANNIAINNQLNELKALNNQLALLSAEEFNVITEATKLKKNRQKFDELTAGIQTYIALFKKMVAFKSVVTIYNSPGSYNNSYPNILLPVALQPVFSQQNLQETLKATADLISATFNDSSNVFAKKTLKEIRHIKHIAKATTAVIKDPTNLTTSSLLNTATKRLDSFQPSRTVQCLKGCLQVLVGCALFAGALMLMSVGMSLAFASSGLALALPWMILASAAYVLGPKLPMPFFRAALNNFANNHTPTPKQVAAKNVQSKLTLFVPKQQHIASKQSLLEERQPLLLSARA